MSVAESTIISYWFKGKSLSLALAIDSSYGRVGSVLSREASTRAYEAHGLGFACLLCLFVCIYSILCTFGLTAFDKYAENLYPEGRKGKKTEERFKFSDIYSFKRPFWLICASCCFTFMSFYTYF